MIGILTPDEIERTLGRSRIGRIGCSANDRPYVVPITYVYLDGCVYAYSALGRKIRIMREQPCVCFEVEEIDSPSSWRSVIADGEYEEVAEGPARREALTLLGLDEAALVHRSPHGNGGAVVFRLRLDSKSGRFERRDA